MRIVVPKSSVSPAPPPGSSQNSSGIRVSTVQTETANRVVNRVPDPDSTNASQPTTQNVDNHVNNVSNNQNSNIGSTSVPPAGRHVKKMRKSHNNNNTNNEDDGYNSEEEQRLKRASLLDKIRTIEDVKKLIMDSEDEMRKFAEDLKREKGFIIKPMGADGNCLFRSVADQIYGDQEMHDQVRERCMNYIEAERDHYSQFVTEDFTQYIARKRRDKCYGNNLEIQAMGELYNRPIQIFTYSDGKLQEPINIFHEDYVTDNPPIRLSYHNGNHYNSVIDPNNPTVGVGLGLPDFVPGLADKMQVKEAIQQSESMVLESEIVQQTKKESEIDDAQKQLEEAIIEQSRKEAEKAMLDSTHDLDYEQQLMLLTEQEIEDQILLESQKEYYEQLQRQFQSKN